MILYKGGAKSVNSNWYLRKIKLVSNVEVYWKLSSSKMMGDQGWCMDEIRESIK